LKRLGQSLWVTFLCYRRPLEREDRRDGRRILLPLPLCLWDSSFGRCPAGFSSGVGQITSLLRLLWRTRDEVWRIEPENNYEERDRATRAYHRLNVHINHSRNYSTNSSRDER
jgi:hypothetical protein